MSRFASLALLLVFVSSVARAQDATPTAPEAQAEVAPAPLAEPAIPAPATAPSPRVVVVVRGGDPSADVVEAARLLDEQLGAAGLTLPTDEGMRVVLRGGVPASPEGYEPARAARMRLGWSPEADREALVGIGRFVEADAVVVVTGTSETITVEVFDPGASDFYEGSASIAADDPSPAVPFVRSRARAAMRRRIDPAAAAARTERRRTTTAPAGADLTEDAAPAEEPRWIKRNWPIILAGALLAGTITYFVVSRRRDVDSDPPVIIIRPGGN